MKPPLTRLLAAGLALSLLGTACSDDGDGDATEGTPSTEADAPAEVVLDAADATAVATTYADLAFRMYDDNVAAATELQGAIATFGAAPDEAGLEAAKQAWLDARDLYGPTEVLRFYDGPIDHPEDGPEGQINAWPMDEAYVDYVDGDAEAGIVNDTEGYPEITVEALTAANEEGGETNISTGWHAIEFLLWGQDLSDDGPGVRPVTDYTTSPTAERRAAYLTALAELLVTDLTSVRDQWDPENGAYREELLSDTDEAITHILRGMGFLSAEELAGERILVAYETQDQEDEHSCFSDNTTADVVGNAKGIRIAYTADWPGVEGTSLADVMAEADADANTALLASLDDTVAQAEALEPPFDRILVDDEARETLRTLAEDLQAQGDQVGAMARSLGYDIGVG